MELLIRSQRFNDLFYECLKLGLVLLFEMSLIRFIYYHLAKPGMSYVTREEVYKAFLVGVRFDLLVLGFVFIPVVLVGALMMMAGTDDFKVNKVLKVYLSTTWALVVLNAFWSLPYYLIKGRHFRWEADGFNFLWPRFDSFTEVLVVLIFGFLVASPIKSIWRRNYLLTHDWHWFGSQDARWQIPLRIIIPILLVGLAARGTVTPRHLEKAHAEISKWENINELALNATWCFDK